MALLASAPARADLCELEDSPAATLLLPYFEVDVANPGGLTTLFSINNASAMAVLTNVVLWTDLGVPTLGFQVYLTGYDVQTINLRDIFNGILPRTASDGQDPSDHISPQGEFSEDIDFASCTGLFPYPLMPAGFAEHLRAIHSGQSSAVLGACAAQDRKDGRVRGYVTVDTVNACALKVPGDPGYFGAGGTGLATNQNVLWGDFFYVDPANDHAQGENLVRVEAFTGAFKPGDRTFYGRYVDGSAADEREPLATVWTSRYVNGGAFSGGTDLVVWRDSGQAVRPFPCGTQPAGFPLRFARELTFDEEENPVTLGTSPATPTLPGDESFPAEANKVHVGGIAFPMAFDFGWLFLDLNPPAQGGRPIRQSWVGTLMSAQGLFSVGYNATPLDSACAPLAPLPLP
jgi:hypothetical protein